MPVDRQRVLGLALEKLLEEKKRIDDEIAGVRAQMRAPSKSATVKRTKSRSAKKKAAKKSQYAKTSSTMKRKWKKARAAGSTTSGTTRPALKSED